MFMTVKQVPEKQGLSERRVYCLCAEERIHGAAREGRSRKLAVR